MKKNNQKKSPQNNYYEEEDEKYADYPAQAPSTFSKDKIVCSKTSRKVLARSVDRDYYQELLDGSGVDGSGCSEMPLRLGSKDLTRERLNHILLEAGRRLVGIDD